jgi:hypothetical protein
MHPAIYHVPVRNITSLSIPMPCISVRMVLNM